MSTATLRQRIASLDGARNRAECELVALEACDPHAALGVSGRRIQKFIEAYRAEIKKLRDVLAVSRRLDQPEDGQALLTHVQPVA